jgi:hypothetical protein
LLYKTLTSNKSVYVIKIDKKTKKFFVDEFTFTVEAGVLSQLGFISIVSIFLTIFKMNIKKIKLQFKIPGMNEIPNYT